MSLYRGAGGASDATDDSTVNAVAGYASSAASSATAAATSATNASNSASASAASASNSSNSAYQAQVSRDSAQSAAFVANTAAGEAFNNATLSNVARGQAQTAAGQASSYSSQALGYRNTASTHATNAANSASAAASSATAAAGSAASALAIYGNTAAMEAAVADAVEAAATAQQESQNASDSAVASAASAALAYEHEQNAAEWATTAQVSANSAQAYATSALAARDATLQAYDTFDDRYLGTKSSEPTVDNDGNPLIAGALYFSSITGSMKVYTGSAWVDAYVSGTGFLAINNNLSDLQSASTARTNLGLGTSAVENSTALVHTTGNETIAGTKTFSSNPILNAGTANGVAYINGSKVLTTGSALTFNGTDFRNSGTSGVVRVRAGSGSQYVDLVADNGSVPKLVYSQAWGSLVFGSDSSGTITELMRLTSTGLGIGTSSPAAKLDVVNGQAYISATSSQYALGLRYNSSTNGTLLGSPAANTFTISTWGGTEQLRLDSSGNLGIGTSSPQAKLHVTTGATGVQALFAYGTGTPTIAIGNSATNYNLQLGYNVNSEYGYIQATAATGVYDDIAINPLGGNVGIGTSSPSDKLQIQKVVGGAYGGGVIAGGLQINTGYAAGDGGYGHNGITFYGDADNASFIYQIHNSSTDSQLAIGTNNTERARIDSSGNLGLGVTPSAWSLGRAFENSAGAFFGYSTSELHVTQNAYYNAGWKYTNSSVGAGRYFINSGAHSWYTAPSGTAGNAISFTQALTLNADGSLLLGGTSTPGAKVFYIANATTVPASNPSGGGVLYVEGGALKYRGSSGTVTTIAAA